MNIISDTQVVNWIYPFEEELGWTSPGADDNLSHQSSTTLHYSVAFCWNLVQVGAIHKRRQTILGGSKIPMLQEIRR